MLGLVAADTTALSYWFNWRFFLCAIWILFCFGMSSFFIWKEECFDNFKSNGGGTQQDTCNDDEWRPILKQVHPFWLLAFRVTAFCFLLTTLIVKVLINGGTIFFYYTQWTFTLLTLYFGFGSLLSIYGCHRCHKISRGSIIVHHNGVAEDQRNSIPLTNGRNTQEKFQASAVIRYLFQVLFQTIAGAVVLTDLVYWGVIFPFLTLEEYKLNLMTVNMHAINAFFLLGDTALNSMQFPWFRISYFILWTSIFVIFQWILHASVSIWWPYPFLELSSPFAPLWYLLVGLAHFPCYCIFALVMKLKHFLLSKWFAHSYQGLR
ncbi:uncharacterized protein LOC18050877 [Citrus clementina]|nr:uncharacterized protein LOC18050877 [Citrus x clementina]